MNVSRNFSVEKRFYRSEGGIWSVSPVNPGSQIPLITEATEYSCESLMG